MLISVDAQKAFNKIQHSFIIRILNKVVIEVTYLNVTKTKFDKTTGNIILNGEKMNIFL